MFVVVFLQLVRQIAQSSTDIDKTPPLIEIEIVPLFQAKEFDSVPIAQFEKKPKVRPSARESARLGFALICLRSQAQNRCNGPVLGGAVCS